MMRTRLCLMAAAALSACAPLPPAPTVQIVKIPVVERCAGDMPSRPAFAVDALPIGAAIDEQTRALRAERQQRKGYEIKLEAALKACVE